MGHAAGVTSVAYSCSGRALVSGSLDNSVILWDVESAERKNAFAGSADAVTSVAFSFDGPRSGVYGTRLPCGKRTLLGHAGRVSALAFSSGGAVVSGSWDNSVVVWDYRTGEKKLTLHHSESVWSVAVSSDETTVASGTKGLTACIPSVHRAHLLSSRLSGNISLFDILSKRIFLFSTHNIEHSTSLDSAHPDDHRLMKRCHFVPVAVPSA